MAYKVCGCKQVYETKEEFEKLEFDGNIFSEDDEGIYILPLFYCKMCRSRIGVESKVQFPTKEAEQRIRAIILKSNLHVEAALLMEGIRCKVK